MFLAVLTVLRIDMRCDTAPPVTVLFGPVSLYSQGVVVLCCFVKLGQVHCTVFSMKLSCWLFQELMVVILKICYFCVAKDTNDRTKQQPPDGKRFLPALHPTEG